jgi:hypothetical protein
MCLSVRGFCPKTSTSLQTTLAAEAPLAEGQFLLAEDTLNMGKSLIRRIGTRRPTIIIIIIIIVLYIWDVLSLNPGLENCCHQRYFVNVLSQSKKLLEQLFKVFPRLFIFTSLEFIVHKLTIWNEPRHEPLISHSNSGMVWDLTPYHVAEIYLRLRIKCCLHSPDQIVNPLNKQTNKQAESLCLPLDVCLLAYWTYSFTLTTETVPSSETLATVYQTTRRHTSISENSTLHSHRPESINQLSKSVIQSVWAF